MKTATTSTAPTVEQGLPPVLVGLCWCFGFVLLATVLTTTLLQYSQLAEANLPQFSLFANAIGILLGGFMAGRRAGSRGLMVGGMTGIVYGLMMLLIGFLGFDFALRWEALLAWLCSSLLGSGGGVIGVNLR